VEIHIRDFNGSISRGIDDLWENYLGRLQAQLGGTGELTFSRVLDSLWKSEEFNEDTVAHVRDRLNRHSRQP